MEHLVEGFRANFNNNSVFFAKRGQPETPPSGTKPRFQKGYQVSLVSVSPFGVGMPVGIHLNLVQ
jgi:hypothetical protein